MQLKAKVLVFFTLLVFGAQTSYATDANGDYVVIFHGIARSSSHMKPLANFLEQAGYDVLNIDYPSTNYRLEVLVGIVDNEVSAKIKVDKPVHFIGYSMGGLLVRALLDKHRFKNLGRTLQLAPPNNGSEVADFMKNNYFFKKIFGPAGQQLTTNNNHTKQLLGIVDYELGVIAGNRTIDPISSYLINGDNDGKVSIASTKVHGMKAHTIVSATHTFFPRNKQVHSQVLNFLKYGKFK